MDFTEENPLSVSSVGAAVRTNNVEAVRKSIGRGRSIDLKDNRGWAAIHCAASNNFTDCLNVLLKAGADTNIRTHEGETPLFLACTSNCYEAAIILLEAECLINLPNNENVTPLHIAACKGFTRLVSLLLDKKADINAKDYDSDTPLMEAVRHEHADVCRILVSHGADQTICGSQEQLPIHMACATSNLQILRVLLHSKQYTTEYLHKVVNWIDITGYSPLMVAVRSHNLPCVEELLKSGADTKKGVCKNSCMTTLHLAAFHGNLPILKVILNATSKDAISFCDQSIRTNLICCAIDSESEECLSYLLDYGLQSEVLNSCFFEFNPIIYFLYNKFKKLRILEILLESGYDPNFENNAITVNIACILYNYLQSNRIENELAETVVHKLVDHGMYVDSYHKTDEIFQFDELSLSIKYSILGGRYRLIPYLLQRSVITEPYHVLNYILLHAQWKTTHDMSALITLLCHYVDPSNLLRTLLLRRPSGDNGSSKVEFLSHLVKFPSLKGMARSAIRKYIHIVCNRNEHQFKVKLNSLDLPADLISYLNYEGMQEFYKSLENCRQDTIPECTSL